LPDDDRAHGETEHTRSGACAFRGGIPW
jgi:hypothetical protein